MKTRISERHQQQNTTLYLTNQNIEANYVDVIEQLTALNITSHKKRSANLNQKSKTRSVKIALYSHDTMGLGHSRRNRLLAQTLAKSRLSANILMIAGVPEQDFLSVSPNIDYLTLPSLYKEVNGEYRSRHLNLPLPDIISLRSKIIRAAIKTFKPDVFIVDNVPIGALGELESTLKRLREHKRTHCVLGLRDVLDEPEVVRREWKRKGNESAICKYYDHVWIYGDPNVYNSVKEYGFSPEVAAKTRYLGYLDQTQRFKFKEFEHSDPLNNLNLPPGKLVLCLVGGGQDGANLAQAFSQAVLPPETNGVIIAGPFMPLEVKQQLYSCAETNPHLRVLDFVPEPTLLLSRADRVIAMGGYNTTCEILSFEKRALIVPRVEPRKEQLIRAERLQNMGLIDMLHPDNLNPSALSEWLYRDEVLPLRIRERLDLNALDRLPYLLEEVLVS